jgi:hypothetical protein
MSACQQLGGAYREIGVIERHQVGTFAADRNIELIRTGPRGVHLVVDRDRLIHRGERVVPIGAGSAHLEGEIDLGRHPNAYAVSGP